MNEKIAMEQVFLRVLRFSPVNIIAPGLCTNLQLHVVCSRRPDGLSLGRLQKA